ncbi:MAG TPA: NAD-dependent epimerase/dehydratase family protein [Gemmatimonadaceae bacterium]|nr:NAD-dependent epimerase/dehydratase family protein [Gemmatimonadaceae bacterium]
MSRRALVTGGAGFIGSHVTDAFIAAGYDVTIIDDFSSGKELNVNPAATVVRESIASPAAAALIRDGRFDVICHLAAQIDVRKSVEDPAWDAAVNIGGSLNLLEAVRKSGHATRFIFASSGGAQYGDLAELPTVETSAKDPQSPYGIAKLSVEYYMSYYARIHGLDTVALRFANVYGPRQDPHGEAGVVAIFCQRILSGTPLTAYGDGMQTRDYVFVGDVARANLLAAEATLPEAGRLDYRGFNIGTAVETSVVALAAGLQNAAGSQVPVNHADARAGEQRQSCLAVTKSAEVLGWTPQVSLADGLKATLEFFRAERTRTTA